MKIAILTWLLLATCSVAIGQQVQQTPNIGLETPAFGSNEWNVPLNYNFTQLDLYLSGNLPIPAINVTGPAILPGLTTWLSTIPYGAGAVVVYQGVFFTSLVSTNQNNIPANGSFWTNTISGSVLSVFGRTGNVIAVSGDYSVGQVTGAAPLASPTFTGTPAGPTAAPGTNTTQLATTAYVQANFPTAPVASVFGRTGAVAAQSGDYSVGQVTGAAPLASPGFSGTPTAPTASPGTNTTQVATTAFVLADGAQSVTNNDGTLTISPTTGAVVASLALGNANTWTALQTFSGGVSTLSLSALAAGITALTANTAAVANGVTSVFGGSETVASSTTPTLSTSKDTSYMLLTGSVTTFTLGNGLVDGQRKTICWGQGAGSFTVNPPTNVHGFAAPGTTASLFSCQDFKYNGANSIWLASSPGVINE